MDLLKRMIGYMDAQSLIPKNRRILAAVSGGMDSMCMADLLRRAGEKLGFSVAIATFDHQLRPTSAMEAVFVKNWAFQYQLPFYQGSENIALLSGGSNVEDTARRARYAYLRKAAADFGDATIAVAHHRDDQAETVLLHLLRGAASTGLAALHPKRDDVIRPLLAFSREEIRAYCQSQKISYVEDESNQDTVFLRNRIRHQLLPVLQTYNPQITDALCATAQVSKEEDSLLDALATEAFDKLWNSNEQCLDRAALDRLPMALQRRIMRRAALLSGGHELSFFHTEALLALKEEQSMPLPGNILAYRRDALFFGTTVPAAPVFAGEHLLICDGEWHRPSGAYFEYRAACHVSDADDDFHKDKFSLILPLASSHGLFWRSRRPGDAVPSQGKAGKRKLKELFYESGIPVSQRNVYPVLAEGDDIRWVPGIWRLSTEKACKDAPHLLIQIHLYDTIKR